MNSINVQRETYIKSDGRTAVYAQGQSYTGTRGVGLVEAVSLETVRIERDDRGSKYFRYYHPRGWSRISNDNGRTWLDMPDIVEEGPDLPDGIYGSIAKYFLDPVHDLLMSLSVTYEVKSSGMRQSEFYIDGKTIRPYCRISRDAGNTWEELQQVIDSRPGYDAGHWGPGLKYGVCGGYPDGPCIWLPDGSLVIGITAYGGPLLENTNGVIFARGIWKSDMSSMDWRFGDIVTVDPEHSSVGCNEPTVTHIGGMRLFTAMRCQGDERRGIYSMRYTAVSDDGGMTWSKPEPLLYDDGSPVWNPASYSTFFESLKTGKTYWIANILSGPVYAQEPRYPLAIAEFDRERLCILKDSVRVIQELPAGAPKQRRYTNWGMYEERGSGDLILTLPEQPWTKNWEEMDVPEDMAADCIRYRIRFED